MFFCEDTLSAPNLNVQKLLVLYPYFQQTFSTHLYVPYKEYGAIYTVCYIQ
jgi:hypothetical protein